jgi:hypothetical protein
MKNIFLISLIFFVSTLKSQDDVYYVITDTVKHEKVKKLKYPSSYKSTRNVDYYMYNDFYYTSRRYPYRYRLIDEIPYTVYYYEDIFYNPTRNSNSFDDVPNKINFKPRTTENKPKIEKKPTNPRTGGRNF